MTGNGMVGGGVPFSIPRVYHLVNGFVGKGFAAGMCVLVSVRKASMTQSRHGHMARSVSGAGAIPSALSRAMANRSIAPRDHSSPDATGGVALRIGSKLQWREYSAPSSIQRTRIPFCSSSLRKVGAFLRHVALDGGRLRVVLLG